MSTEMSNEELKKELSELKSRLDQAELWADREMKDPALHQLIRVKESMESIIRKYGHERFGPKLYTYTPTWLPEIKRGSLSVCDICGQPGCFSDHK